jgi:N-acetylglucosamine kinase-like BadF-type ATPase
MWDKGGKVVILLLNHNRMRLIIDAGSTKMGWILMDSLEVKARFVTKGFNPNYSPMQDLVEMCYGASLPNGIRSIHYYGTGCGNEQNCQTIKEVFQSQFPDADIHVTHDLMAACHALFGRERGIACILGTGSNSCFYDGENIIEKAVSLGYLVGDEGSGMHIGKEVLKAYFYGFMPKDLRMKFEETYHLEIKDFIDKVYHQPQPSRYLATFAKFAGEHQSNPFIKELVKGCFRAFIEAFILRYEDCKSLKVSFIGSVAFHFQDILRESLAYYGLTLGEIMQAPVEGLIKYYGGKV